MPAQRPSVFISYARADDEPFVWRVYEWLSHPDRGFSVWFDRKSMPSRSLSFLQKIRDAISEHERVLLILGPSAVGSDYVRAEWQYALASEHVVVPVLRLGDFRLMPPELKNLHCPDARAESKEPAMPTSYEKFQSWLALARYNEVSDSGHIDEALNRAEEVIAEMMTAEDPFVVLQREPALQELAGTLADGGRFDEAMRLVSTIADGWHRILAICHLGLVMSRKGDPMGPQMLRGFLWSAGLTSEAREALADAKRRAQDEDDAQDKYRVEELSLLLTGWGDLRTA